MKRIYFTYYPVIDMDTVIRYGDSEPPNRRLFLLCPGQFPLLAVHTKHTMVSVLRMYNILYFSLCFAYSSIAHKRPLDIDEQTS